MPLCVLLQVISLRYAFQTVDNIFLVMDLVGGGDLYQLLDTKGRLPEAWVVVYAAEVALALEHVHAHDVLYALPPLTRALASPPHPQLTRSPALSRLPLLAFLGDLPRP